MSKNTPETPAKLTKLEKKVLKAVPEHGRIEYPRLALRVYDASFWPLPAPSIFRALKSLQHKGYVVASPDGGWSRAGRWWSGCGRRTGD